MATTYTRIKNRRGLKIDLPQPLADGEIGLATDTREVYIGAGTQDLLNADVQVTPFLNAQAEVTDDLSNGTSSATNNGILNFNISVIVLKPALPTIKSNSLILSPMYVPWGIIVVFSNLPKLSG